MVDKYTFSDNTNNYLDIITTITDWFKQKMKWSWTEVD